MSEPVKLPADEFVHRFRDELIPLNSKIQWLSLLPLGDDELASSIQEPLESLPPKLTQLLPRVSLFLVPYLAMRGKQPDLITFDKPEAGDRSESFQIVGPDAASLVIATGDLSPNEYHYNLYNAISSLAWEVAPAELRDAWSRALKDELRREVHGEIDEISWQRKNELLAKQSQPVRESKMLRDYVRAAFIDTLTLFLHGICCDIDVEPSPRQIPSNEIRRRLELLRGFYPLGEGYALFPEELGRVRSGRDERLRGSGSETNGVPAPKLDAARADRGDEQERGQDPP